MKKIAIFGLMGVVFALIVFSVAKALEPIQDIQGKFEQGKIVITWKKVDGAANYKVFDQGGVPYQGGEVGNRLSFTYTPGASFGGEQHVFKIRAYKSGESEPFAGGETSCKLDTQTCDSSVSPPPASEGGSGPTISAPFKETEPTTNTDLIKHLEYGFRWAYGIGSLLAVFMILFGAFYYVTSGGNPQALQNAKDTIVGALIGLALLLLLYLLLPSLGVDIKLIPPREESPPTTVEMNNGPMV